MNCFCKRSWSVRKSSTKPMKVSNRVSNLWFFIWDSTVKYNYVRNFRQQTAQQEAQVNTSKWGKNAKNRFPRMNPPLVSHILHNIKALVYVLIVLTHISCKTNRFHQRCCLLKFFQRNTLETLKPSSKLMESRRENSSLRSRKSLQFQLLIFIVYNE